MRSNLVLSIRAEYERVTCPCGGAPHNKDYTTLLPNIGFYDIQTSVVVGQSGYRKQRTSAHSIFPAKKRGEETEKYQRGLKTASLVSEFFYYTGQKCSKWVKPNNTGQKIGKKGFN